MKNRKNWVNHSINFIVVILGVYLAFYLNEKSEINKEIKESKVLMNSLVTDISEDIKTYVQYQIPKNIQQKQSLDKLLNLLAKNNVVNIEKELLVVFQVENYTPTMSTYSSMKSSGKLKLINDLNLRKELNDYYEGFVVESIKKGEFQVEYFKNELLKWLTNNVDLMKMKFLKNHKLIELRNKIIVYESLIEQKINSYKLVLENSKQLKLNIESRLK